MKETPLEKSLYRNFLPGILTKDGFIGEDKRHIHDIIEEDIRELERLGISEVELAKKLQELIDFGKKNLEEDVRYEHFIINVRWSRGMLPCPFGEPPLHYKIYAKITNTKLDKTIVVTQLGIHLMEKHVFFYGKGSKYRLEPVFLYDFLFR